MTNWVEEMRKFPDFDWDALLAETPRTHYETPLEFHHNSQSALKDFDADIDALVRAVERFNGEKAEAERSVAWREAKRAEVLAQRILNGSDSGCGL
jgi:cobalamin-dependent methionine synthase I